MSKCEVICQLHMDGRCAIYVLALTMIPKVKEPKPAPEPKSKDSPIEEPVVKKTRKKRVTKTK